MSRFDLFASDTVKHHEVNPAEYLEFVINTISGYPFKQLVALLPQNWKTTFSG